MSAGAQEIHWVKPLIAAGSLAYLAAACVLMVRVGDPLFEPLHNYYPAYSWLLFDADDARIKALMEAGRPQTAMLYDRLEMASGILVLFGAVVGACGAFMKARRLEVSSQGLVALSVTSLLFYGLFTVGTALADIASNTRVTTINLAAYPGIWFVAVLPAAVLMAFTVGLLIHTALLRALVPAALLVPPPEEDPVYY